MMNNNQKEVIDHMVECDREAYVATKPLYRSPYSPEFLEFKRPTNEFLESMSKDDLLDYVNDIYDRLSYTDIKANQAIRDIKMYRNELRVYKKALELYVHWADECDFGYDQIPDEYEKYKDVIEKSNMGYCEGLMYIAKEEAREIIFRRKREV